MDLEQYTSSANTRLLDNTMLKEKIKMFENFKASKVKTDTNTEIKANAFEEIVKGLVSEQLGTTINPIFNQLEEIIKTLEELKLKNDNESVESNTELKGETITIEQAVHQSSTGLIDYVPIINKGADSQFPKAEEKPIEVAKPIEVEKPKDEGIIIEAKIHKHKKKYYPECPIIYHQNLDRVIKDSKEWNNGITDPYQLFVSNPNEAKILQAFRNKLDYSSADKTRKMINSIKKHSFF